MAVDSLSWRPEWKIPVPGPKGDFQIEKSQWQAIGAAVRICQDLSMTAQIYLRQLSRQLSYLLAFARQINELDFAASLSGEFRGMQDAGWATTITAHEVFAEISTHVAHSHPRSKAEIRVLLFLYCQLAEAGGVYETLKNMMGIITLKPYLLWPFQDLVRVRQHPRRVIGPNANATFRDLAETAQAIGMPGLASALEEAFRDDIRNGIYHADYVIWEDGLRLRRRNDSVDFSRGQPGFDERCWLL